MIATYVLAVAAADLAVYAFGARALPFTAFLMVGMELGARNRLHDAWEGRHCWTRMVALIASGSTLSAILCPASSRVAASSFAAFLVGGVLATAAYARGRGLRPTLRGGLASCVGAGIDSTVFPTLAFGAVDPVLCVSQFAGKAVGGVVWSWALSAAGAVATRPGN